MNNMNNNVNKSRPSMKRKPFRKHRPDQRRTNNYGSNNGSSQGDVSTNSHDFENGGTADMRAVKKAQGAREKYLTMARDALSDGDRVLAENYFQHADHYLRVINSGEPVRPVFQQSYQPHRTHSDNNESIGNTLENGNAEINPRSQENDPATPGLGNTEHVPAFLKVRENPEQPDTEKNYNS